MVWDKTNPSVTVVTPPFDKGGLNLICFAFALEFIFTFFATKKDGNAVLCFLFYTRHTKYVCLKLLCFIFLRQQNFDIFKQRFDSYLPVSLLSDAIASQSL